MKVTADDIAQLLASSPPRQVPAHVLKAARGRGSLIGVLFGLAFGSFGSVFLVFFFPWRALDEIRLSAGGRETPGVIIAQHETNMSVNETKVVGHRFQFTAADGTRQEAECFTTGPRWGPGLAVAVRYLPGNPAIACIEGARLNKAGWWAGFVVIFPLVGFGIVAAVILSGRSTARLLREGHATEVDVLAVDATSTQINYQTVYKITVASPSLPGGQPVTIRRWGRPEVNLLTSRALQKQPIYVLYDPRKPKRLIFPEGLIDAPGS